MAPLVPDPDDLPLFDVSTHDLYALAHGLIESDVDHEFCHRLFAELVKWHKKVGGGGKAASVAVGDRAAHPRLTQSNCALAATGGCSMFDSVTGARLSPVLKQMRA